MTFKRRQLFRITAGLTAAAVLGARGVRGAAAAEWNKSGFSASTVADAMKSIGANNPSSSKDILFKAPDVAENGAVVPIEITSRIPNTQSITIIADKNPFPLVASFDFSANSEPYANTRIKLADTSNVRAIVKAGGQHYMAVREVKVTIGGCA